MASTKNEETVKVMVRIRPMNTSEKSKSKLPKNRSTIDCKTITTAD
jgi:hypothetical protein